MVFTTVSLKLLRLKTTHHIRQGQNGSVKKLAGDKLSTRGTKKPWTMPGLILETEPPQISATIALDVVRVKNKIVFKGDLVNSHKELPSDKGPMLFSKTVN